MTEGGGGGAIGVIFQFLRSSGCDRGLTAPFWEGLHQACYAYVGGRGHWAIVNIRGGYRILERGDQVPV